MGDDMGLGLTIIVIDARGGRGRGARLSRLRAPGGPARSIRRARAPAGGGRQPPSASRLQEAENRNAALEAARKAERESHEKRVAELTRMGAELERKFAGLASEALGKNSESFLKLVSERFDKHSESAKEDLEKRRAAIETLVKPLGDSLTKFEQKVGEIEKERTGAYEKITEQVKSLAEGQTGLRSETSRLVQALRRPETRGRWGEYQLRNVLEMAGMTKHVDFVEQPTVAGDEGRLRPDVIVHVPRRDLDHRRRQDASRRLPQRPGCTGRG